MKMTALNDKTLEVFFSKKMTEWSQLILGSVIFFIYIFGSSPQDQPEGFSMPSLNSLVIWILSYWSAEMANGRFYLDTQHM